MSVPPVSTAAALAVPRPTLATAKGGSAGQSTASPATDRSTQEAALAALLRSYTRDIAQGQQADQLTTLAKQITAAAKALGEVVSLPTAPPPSGADGGVNKVA